MFGGKLNVLGLYHKLGLTIETVSRGRNANMLSQFEDFTPEEAAKFQEQMDTFYRTFLTRVSEGRGMTPAAVEAYLRNFRYRMGPEELDGLDTFARLVRAGTEDAG